MGTSTKLSKTNYIIYRDCPKNAWVKVNKPEVYKASELSEFEKMIIETGNDVDELARDLFPGGMLVKHNVKKTKELIAKSAPIIYQPKFETKNFTATPDILVWNKKTKVYDLYEVKSTNAGENKKQQEDIYAHDIAFQVNVLRELNVPLGHVFLVRLNPDYVRKENIDIKQLFRMDDFSGQAQEIEKDVTHEMQEAYKYINHSEPKGPCSCIIKGRSTHCSTFAYSNPSIPEYSVHDISRIGSSKTKLAALISAGILTIEDVPDDMEFSAIQRNQITAAKTGQDAILGKEIKDFVKNVSYPISFLDYETFPAAVPRFKSYKPYYQIPFQFSVHVLTPPAAKLEQREFIHAKDTAPDEHFLLELQKAMPKTGSVLVWNKSFEMGINKKLAERVPEYTNFVEDLNSRVIDLRDVFTKQLYVTKNLRGSTSIKLVLPALVPELSYKELGVQDGGSASDTWNKIVQGEFSQKEAQKQIEELLKYCKMDTFAMVNIFEVLKGL